MVVSAARDSSARACTRTRALAVAHAPLRSPCACVLGRRLAELSIQFGWGSVLVICAAYAYVTAPAVSAPAGPSAKEEYKPLAPESGDDEKEERHESDSGSGSSESRRA